MKKLMLALVAVVATTVANAGQVKWEVYDFDSPDSGYAYLFTDAIDMAAVETAVLSGNFFSSEYASAKIWSGEIEGGEYKSGAILDGVYSGSTTLWMLALDKDEAGYAQYVISNDDGVTQTIGTSGAKSFKFYYDDNLTTWQSVPEPTSGLLLLLGVAGLALRRRRA